MGWRERFDGDSDRSNNNRPCGAEGRGRQEGAQFPAPSADQNVGAFDARYFLIKASGSDGLQLGQEVASENEALTASFRASGSYAVVTEWRADVDVSTGAPVIKKEVVQRERK